MGTGAFSVHFSRGWVSARAPCASVPLHLRYWRLLAPWPAHWWLPYVLSCAADLQVPSPAPQPPPALQPPCLPRLRGPFPPRSLSHPPASLGCCVPSAQPLNPRGSRTQETHWWEDFGDSGGYVTYVRDYTVAAESLPFCHLLLDLLCPVRQITCPPQFHAAGNGAQDGGPPPRVTLCRGIPRGRPRTGLPGAHCGGRCTSHSLGQE